MLRIQQARRSPTDVNSIGQDLSPIAADRTALQPYPGPPIYLLMFTNFPANRVNVRSKSRGTHHAGVEITVGALRLAKRHLHIYAYFFHHPKTLAYRLAPN